MWNKVMVIGAIIGLAGCGSLANQHEETSAASPVAGPVTVVASSAQCHFGDRQLKARWVVDAQDADAVFKRMGRVRFSGDATVPPELDFSRQRALLISLGAKPTPGYGIDVAEEASITDGVLTLAVALTTPPPGSILPQVLTMPCVVLTVPREGYQRLALVDTDGQMLLPSLPIDHSD